jgi:hypothetical protein
MFCQIAYDIMGPISTSLFTCSLITFFAIAFLTFFDRFSIIYRCSMTSWAALAATLVGLYKDQIIAVI